MKTAAVILILLSAMSAHAGGGGYAYDCHKSDQLVCHSVDGKSLVTITYTYCEMEDYGVVSEKFGLEINSPTGLVAGNVQFDDDKTAWKLSSSQSGKTYELSAKKYSIDLFIDAKRRGPVRVKSVVDNSVVIDSEVVCR